MERPRGARVLLLELRERVSAKGNRYLSGWLGKAGVVAFPGEPTEAGEPVWRVFVSEPEPRPQVRDAGGGASAPEPAAKPSAMPQERGSGRRGDGWLGQEYRRPANGAQRAPQAADEPFFDDNLEDLGR